MDIELPHAFATASILILSVLVPLYFSFLSTVVPPRIHKTPFNYLAQARRRKEMYMERERCRALAKQRKEGFPFHELAQELQLAVLSQCAGWLPMDLSLLLVSKRVNAMAIEACLPYLPVRLVSSNQITSFSRLLTMRPELVHRVRHLWVTPVEESNTAVCRYILKRCVGIRSVGCNVDMLRESVLDCDQLEHLRCTNATILWGKRGMESIANSAMGIAFLRQLTHLRVVGHTIPRSDAYERLTHLSYELDRRAEERSKKFAWKAFEDTSTFPCLLTVLLTRVRYCSDPAADLADWKRPEKVVMLYIPREESEMQKWCEGVNGHSIWEQARLRLEGMMTRRSRPGFII